MASQSPRTPFTRTTRAESSSSPTRSSPLNPDYKQNNPPSQRRGSYKNQFQTSSRYTRSSKLPTSILPSPALSFDNSASGSSTDSAQKALWREKFLQRCAERVEKDKNKFKDGKRSAGGFSRDLGKDEEDDMDTDEFDGLDNEVSFMHGFLVPNLSPNLFCPAHTTHDPF